MAMSKIKALQAWCKRTLEGYRDVNITDMTTSWRSGLAFCAMIHKFRPDLINYDALDKENVYENNKLAFDVAEKELNIAALLEAADMVAMKVPDRLSIITYVAQYHTYFKDKPVLGGPGISVANKQATPGGVKRHHEGSEPQSRPEVKRFTPSHENKQDKAQETSKPRVASMGETCQICRNKVYLLERHIEDGKLYHRSCFRHSDMSPSSKVYAKPSALLEEGRKEKDLPVKGMTNLGKGFAAPEKSEPSRSKSPARSTARVALNMNSHNNERYKDKSSDNGHGKEHNNSAKSVLDRLEEKSLSDWKSKRSQSPKAEQTPDSSSAKRPGDLPGKLSQPSEKWASDKWPPSKDDKSSSRPGRDGTGQKVTPVPRPRQSLVKEEEKSSKGVGQLEGKKRSRFVEPMEVDEPTQPSHKTYTSELDAVVTKRTEPRKLPLALQSAQSNTGEDKSEPVSDGQKESTGPSPKTRLFLKKGEMKSHGSTEKLNKTVGERIKESKERARLKSEDDRCKPGREESVERLSKDRSKAATPPASSPEGSTPPPLPRSTPPELAKSPTSRPTTPSTQAAAPPRPPTSPTQGRRPKSPVSQLTSPVSAPTRPPRALTNRAPSPSRRSGPPKPPRAGVPEQAKENPSTPEDVPSKVPHWDKDSPPVAVVVYPGSPPPEEEADQRVLGGLLKSLANVRHRQPDSHPRSETGGSASPIVVPPRSRTSDSTTTTTTGTTSSTTAKHVLSNNIRNAHGKVAENATDKVTGHSYLSRSKRNEKSTSGGEIIDTTPIPAWQKEVAKRKAEKDSKSKQRPKSTTSILDYHHGKEDNGSSRVTDHSRDKNKTTQSPVVDTTPTPAWQKEIRRKKENKPSRPKSMEVLSDENGDLNYRKGKQDSAISRAADHSRDKNKTTHNSVIDTTPTPAWQKEVKRRKDNKTNQPKSTEVLSDENGDLCIGEENLKVLNMSKGVKKKDNRQSKEPKSQESIPDWQKEAQKRIEERKGNYVDPEKKRIVPERPERPNLEKSTMKHIEIVENGHTAGKKNAPTADRVKVSPGVKFNFDDSSLDSSSELSPRDEKNKKGRQPPPRPKSPPPINRATKHQRYSAGSKATPPRSGMSPGKLTPMEIQRQLMDIDSKLTDLELKGRRLEDSIRNAREDEEDALMIDWFLLVSQKNELVRQEADLIYAARENELEDEQDSVQDQLRRLLDKPNKTSDDRQQEEFLLGKLLDIVDQRSKIIDSIDDDKHRYEEEDREIAIVLEKKAFGDISF